MRSVMYLEFQDCAPHENVGCNFYACMMKLHSAFERWAAFYVCLRWWNDSPYCWRSWRRMNWCYKWCAPINEHVDMICKGFLRHDAIVATAQRFVGRRSCLQSRCLFWCLHNHPRYAHVSTNRVCIPWNRNDDDRKHKKCMEVVYVLNNFWLFWLASTTEFKRMEALFP